ncbi:hypothetical protein [Rossellomorea aquimaris]|uniref:Uncharacterized protein n=1 Tax=Rossellomorea aquimaris TaxID=189382 RepID=A0A5D4TM54_9BACI|nr:hypothetical protein [Rossellomorea aquimaris]TYS75562.1 hypothetical protein FZC80_17400 [Rossellomorea aquimaris]
MTTTNEKVTVKVNSNEFIWNPKSGLFTFDGAPALLFWDSAIELFLNIQLKNIHTFSTLQHGVEFAVEQNGFEIKRKKE